MEDSVLAMAAAAKEVFGDIPIERTERGISFPMGFGTSGDLNTRPWANRIALLRASPSEAAQFLKKRMTDRGTRYIQCILIRDTADKLFKEKKYKESSVKYVQAGALLLGRGIPFNGPFHLAEYEDLAASWEVADMMGCLNGAAESLAELRQYKQALWLATEVEVVIRNVRINNTRANPTFDWFDFTIQLEEYHFQRLRARVIAQRVFRELGNTGAANERRWHTTTLATLVPKDMETPRIRKIHPTIKLDPVYRLRHPDPALVATLAVVDPASQVLGSWKKVVLKKSGGITSRMGFASFVFEGHLYILGGEKYLKGPWYRDFWRIDLTALDEWQPLPAYPIPQSVTGHLVGHSMVVHGDCAYLFTGRMELEVFDLQTQTWSVLRTSFDASWPYPENSVTDYAMHCVDGKIYIFGGAHMLAKVGCDLLMALDIATRRWVRLSGTALPRVANYAAPGPRRLASTWVSKDRNTLFVMYGDADRQGANMALDIQPHGSMNAYAYDDLWAWDIRARVWEQRRLPGNIPSPRTEMACTYNATLDAVIAFGGYAPTSTSHFERNVVYAFSYYADTFMLRSESGSAAAPGPAAWKHVLTRGFPTYRAQTHLVSDPATGRTFLFGGYVNSEYVPSRSGEESRTFCDLWELRIDVPGGHFEAVDIEDEARTARLGPWQRCFTCGSAGPWKKCGGACKGQAFFCDARCLRDGWKEHKLKHKCRK
ncbi:hypothetical protein B0H15DRAFT_852091 [Mycena belliarum]|uniref:MYND-type domain-containing protein n=1 Tax=Mycena belliarum TaxID=1033014 RepID=A0AAD6U2X4_9AGAR|nr:hypothetical protein B0H15DRAFT_852091 [Mycena belliae]